MPAVQRNPAFATTVRPVREFLKMIVMRDPALAASVRASLQQGESFFDAAAQHSIDQTGPGGGYLGEMWLEQMDPKLADAAAKLKYGETSPVIDTGGKQIILARLPRDFKWQAEQLQLQASKLDAAVEKYQESLRIYPYFLRALIFLGTALGEQGNPERAAGVLQFAAKLYPEDPAAQYNLGIAYGALRRETDEISAYQKAIELEPDLGPAYQNLGSALFSAGRLDDAAEVYRKGLDRNPLSVVLYYNLSVVRRQQQKIDEADKALAAARAIDPGFVRKQEGGL
jgi:tetratricopeptide (TPR) repeat protein